MSWARAKLKYVTRLAYGDAVPQDDPQGGKWSVFGSNGPYTSLSHANTLGPAIIVGRKGSYGKVNWSDEPCYASDTAFFTDATQTRHHLRWLYWVLQTLRLDEGSVEAAVPGLSRDAAYDCELALPPAHVQRAIANFLDRDTGWLDRLIAAKERVLALLEEKRRGLITHAVTRGLDPDAPLRNSGLSWLGDIPAHWKAARLKFLAEIRGGLTLGKKYGNVKLVEVPYLRVANVQSGYVDLTEVTTVEVPAGEAERYLLQPGDVLMTEGGDIDKLGRGCVWRGEVSPCLHQNHIFAIRPHRVSAEWLTLWTSATGPRHYFESRAKRSTNLASISGWNVGELTVALPPKHEQEAIINHIDTGSECLDALRVATKRTIALSHERRDALIAAAVTGQIQIEGVK